MGDACYSPSCRSKDATLCYSPSCKQHSLHLRTVKLVRGASGLGMKIYGSDLNEGVRIGEITPKGAAEETHAIFSGDLIYSINGKNMSKATHDEVVKALSEQSEIVMMLVPSSNISQTGPAPPPMGSFTSPRHSQLIENNKRDSTHEQSPTSSSAASTPAPPPRPPSVTSPLKMPSLPQMPSLPTPSAGAAPVGATPVGSSALGDNVSMSSTDNRRMVKLVRTPPNGYGMKIRSDPNIRGVRVSDMSPAGAAAKCGQIFVGDVILEINGVSMLDASHQDVVKALTERETVTLVLQMGEEAFPATPAIQRKRVRLLRQNAGLGLKIKTEDKDQYARVVEVIPGGAAAVEGSIAVGDRILEVNGVNAAELSHEQLIQALLPAEVVLLVETDPPVKHKKMGALKKFFSKSSSKKDMGEPSLPSGDSQPNVWTQVAEQWAMELQTQLKQSQIVEQQQAKEIARLEATVAELTNEALAAGALRIELQGTKQALEELRAQTMRSAPDSDMRHEVAEKEIHRLREARAEIARLHSLLSEPTETEA